MALLVVPGRWFRNSSTGLACQIHKVAGGWVHVRYHLSGEMRKYRIEQFVRGFISTARPKPGK